MKVEDWDWTRPIFDHVEVHASDYPESVRFYETVLATLGIPRIAETDEWTSFTNLNVVDRTPATRELHVCFRAASREEVDAFHKSGIEAGFRSNGAPATATSMGRVTTLPFCSTPTATTWRRSTGTWGTSATRASGTAVLGTPNLLPKAIVSACGARVGDGIAPDV